MKHLFKFLTVVLAVSVILLGGTFDVAAESPAWQPAATAADEPASRLAPAAKGCTEMEVSDPALWFVVDEEGEVDTEQTVDSYPSGTTSIAAGFEYNCIPKKTTIVTVYYVGGADTDPWYTDKDPLKADDSGGIYSYSIHLKSGKPLSDDSYQVEFYNNKLLLTSGEITLGDEETDITWDNQQEEQQDEDQNQDENQDQDRQEEKQKERQRRDPNKVRIQGTVTDMRTGKPIPRAVFLVLNPGITVAQWADYSYAPSDILDNCETDRNGVFTLATDLDRNEEYSFVVWALSYQGYFQDDFVVTEDDPDPFELAIELAR
jgi:hypothetical protein